MKNKILKPFIQEGSQSQIVDKDDCLIAMDVYLVQFAEFYNKKMDEYAIHCGIDDDLLNEFQNKL
jgi:hypothetical protein